MWRVSAQKRRATINNRLEFINGICAEEFFDTVDNGGEVIEEAGGLGGSRGDGIWGYCEGEGTEEEEVFEVEVHFGDCVGCGLVMVKVKVVICVWVHFIGSG